MRGVTDYMRRLKRLLVARFEAESDASECALYVKSLDRVYRKISACCKMLPGFDFAHENTAIVLGAAHHQIKLYRERVRGSMTVTLADTRANCGKAAKRILVYKRRRLDRLDEPKTLLETVTKLEHAFVNSLKSALANLLLFIG